MTKFEAIAGNLQMTDKEELAIRIHTLKDAVETIKHYCGEPDPWDQENLRDAMDKLEERLLDLQFRLRRAK